MSNWKKVSVTGRRDLIGRESWVAGEFDRLVTKIKPVIMYSGGALGSDMIWAETAIRRGIPLHLLLPAPDQAARWALEDQERWLFLVNRATRVQFSAMECSVDAYRDRNAALASVCDLLVAVWERNESGGTWHTVEMGRGCGVDLLVVDYVDEVTALSRGTGKRARAAAAS